MRIIDKNHDFYDYLQDPTDIIVFDRRKSFLLEKKHVCDAIHALDLRYRERSVDSDHKFMLLQCGAAFWLFLVTVVRCDAMYINHDKVPVDFSLEFIMSWKNYNTVSSPIKVSVVEQDFRAYDRSTKQWVSNWRSVDADTIKKTVTHTARRKDISTLQVSKSVRNNFETYVYTWPILSGIGIGSLVDPLEVFCAIEEHFSREKTASERTEPLGATNSDKIIMHGFDVKTSFRG